MANFTLRQARDRWIAIAGCVLLFSFLDQPAQGGTVTSWPMFHHDATHTGLSPVGTSHNGGLLKWSFTRAVADTASPIVGDDGTIYISGDGLYAIDPDGTLKWKYAVSGDSAGEDTASFASPAIAPGGPIYFGLNNGNFYAVNRKGQLQWSLALSASTYTSTPTLAPNGAILLTTAGLNAPVTPGVYALNPDSSIQWTLPFPLTGALNVPSINSRAQVLVVDFAIYILRGRTGDKVSITDVPSAPDYGFAPAVDANGYTYTVATDGFLAKLGPTGKEDWVAPIGYPNGLPVGVWSSPAISSDGTTYVGSSDGNLYSVSSAGAVNWRFPNITYNSPAPLMLSSPAIGLDGTIYFGSEDEHFYALNPDGSIKWSFAARGPIDTAPAIGPDGTIYFSTDSGVLYALK